MWTQPRGGGTLPCRGLHSTASWAPGNCPPTPRPASPGLEPWDRLPGPPLCRLPLPRSSLAPGPFRQPSGASSTAWLNRLPPPHVPRFSRFLVTPRRLNLSPYFFSSFLPKPSETWSRGPGHYIQGVLWVPAGSIWRLVIVLLELSRGHPGTHSWPWLARCRWWSSLGPSGFCSGVSRLLSTLSTPCILPGDHLPVPAPSPARPAGFPAWNTVTSPTSTAHLSGICTRLFHQGLKTQPLSSRTEFTSCLGASSPLPQPESETRSHCGRSLPTVFPCLSAYI